MTVQTFIPDGIQPQTGEEIQLAVIVLTDGTLRVTRIISRQTPATSATAPKREIMGWVNKWAGTIEMDGMIFSGGIRVKPSIVRGRPPSTSGNPTADYLRVSV